MDLGPVEVFFKSKLASGILPFFLNLTWISQMENILLEANLKLKAFSHHHTSSGSSSTMTSQSTQILKNASLICVITSQLEVLSMVFSASLRVPLSQPCYLAMKQGKVLKEHPPFKLFVSVSGSKFRDPIICDVAYKDIIKVKSVHFIGAKDWLKEPSEDLATAFDSPLIIRHPQGHTVPRLDEAATQQLRAWATEIFSYHSRILNGENHESEKGENKVDDEEEAKPEEVPNKTQVQQDGIGIEVNREVEAVNA
ncbi:ESTERASE OVCA2 [Salix purpurea]|uniref:ESTERASE OVCA2 n=1 Tax=Salix purpurea TaxID=77065 RepID=A0A9Q0Q5M2_SALPP|nr:ESTERASE OVCA2 [Salix purpurea]